MRPSTPALAFATLSALVLTTLASPCAAQDDEFVTFDSARYLVGNLQQRLARERGETLVRPPRDRIQGYLTKPEGAGPFAAVVHLHGCGGLSAERRRAAERQFTGWGYVTLIVDSFTPRGIKETCSGRGPPAPREADAVGALEYLATLPFVDARRIALVGYSQGGNAALSIATASEAPLFEVPSGLSYKAAIAYYPSCGAAGDDLAIPTLILTGEYDDWARASECSRLLRRWNHTSAALWVTIFPEAYHDFDNPRATPYGTRHFGHWLRYNAEAAQAAAGQAREFLIKELYN
ncbi:MAG: dienelactone hydrolase family protein [Proteobacteria bacterium]|nr:dienelactone hydrolase family protein [Pseudomonadota bacterium]